ncbi:hypothetical protein A6V39_04150 [Candidatus Mycoplasma haematobovis]|uniref:DUF2779 domain-containing protein n=1 Tax=Candidatus Mycoplasma haematobovis TaxID=432608 RepID=A0A1A9QDK2_9MOLU|nr:DUF2779 domain-containing protein [Candidatus Mycoplasma haematobovis]OAL10081.1 hypothetical protein A6V39_04150 [Candidatus Mycoplasma haematobovis]
MSNHITTFDFLNYFKKPYIFWFLNDSEIENYLLELLGEEIEESTTLLDLIKLVDSEDNLIKSNYFKLNTLLDEKLKTFFINKFKIPTLDFYDHTFYKDDSTDQFLRALKSSRNAFIFKPKIVCEDLKIIPTAIYKYKNRVYLITHSWSTALKKELIGSLIYYQYVLKKLDIEISQYFISYLSSEIVPNKELIIHINVFLPVTTKKLCITDFKDERIRNVNTYFELENINYGDSLYELLCTREEFLELKNEIWEQEELNIEGIIKELREFKNKPNREVNLTRVVNTYLKYHKFIVTPDSSWYWYLIRKYFKNTSFSGKLLPINKLIVHLGNSNLLSYLNEMQFLNFKEDQAYYVFEPAVIKYNTLKNKTIKIYYDFETLSVPFPYLENTKPFTQIVLQLSLIQTENNKESRVVNIILDPLELKVSDFKRIIDEIYIDAPDVAYIVYNKAFENTRLKEISTLINEEEYELKIVSIIDRTIDLADWFTFGNSPYIIHKELRGFHSIKKVIELIPEELLVKTNTVKYSELERCKNGAMAQALLLSRALASKERDASNWEKNKEFMYIYCENDARSMIAVELFIEKLLDENKYGYYDLKKYLELKKKVRRVA